MSAQQAQHAPVRLLIAERSENAAYQFDSLLRDAGIATRLEVIDLPMAVDKFADADMMLCNAALPELTQLLPRLASLAPRVPIIVVNNDEASLSQTEGMELGAADVVSVAESQHLVLVVKRELDHVCQHIQYRQMKKSLAEAEARCELLLASSRAAIAYVHEGMHIFANEHYLELFGFEDADDLLGLPLMDMLDGASAGTLKERLKQFRNDEQETNFDFVGESTTGETVTGNMTLAAAEYEGEHCLQVTVRSDTAPAENADRAEPELTLVADPETAEAASAAENALENGFAEEAEDDVPVLDADAIVDAPNGAAAAGPESKVEEAADDEEFELEFDAEADSEADAERSELDATVSDDAIDFEFDDDALSDVVEAAVEEDASAEPAQPVEGAKDDSAFMADAIEFTQPDDADGTASDEQSKTTENTAAEDEAASAPSAAVETETEAPAATAAADATDSTGEFSTMLALPDFLSASERLATNANGEFVSVFAAQVDGYEDLQRAFGLAGVDDACKQVAAKLLAEARAPFMQISPSQWAMLVCARTREDAIAKVDAVRAAVEGMMFEVREKTVRPTCTFGGAIFNAEGHDSAGSALEATLDAAFTTLRNTLASSDGNTVQLPAFDNADQEIDDEANRVLVLISEAIEKQSFTLLFQPIISLRGDSDEHYEVFLRMNDREGNQMAPGEFLRTAIDNGVAGKIDRWVILQSIKMLSAHRANGHNTRLTINLTANSVADPEFIQWLGVAIKAARLPSDAVIFQITEADAATYIRQTREFVEGLKNLHCRSSLSRFGLEAEPFEVLGHIPVDFVKLDGSLIEALDKDPSKKDNVTEMVRDLQNAGKLTIVPMVESAGLLSTLWQAGVNYIQGHYLQEPSQNMDYDFSTDD
ncbi:MAG: EAL domain-containing protein [Pseudomonadota bacterium]